MLCTGSGRITVTLAEAETAAPSSSVTVRVAE
jgi:hypothetical protein